MEWPPLRELTALAQHWWVLLMLGLFIDVSFDGATGLHLRLGFALPWRRPSLPRAWGRRGDREG
jgi:hypothetical protein